MNYGIHWFRRDLRLEGNPALTLAARRLEGRVLGVFCFDRKFLAREDFSVNRFQFFLESLSCLREDLRKAGGELLFLDTGPDEAFRWILANAPAPTLVSWNRDYEPFAAERDVRMKRLLEECGIETSIERDHLLLEPHEVHKANEPESGYQIYTPFSKRWMEMYRTTAVKARLAARPRPKLSMSWAEVLKGKGGAPDVFEKYRRSNGARVTIPIPPAGRKAAMGRLRDFRSSLASYAEARDIPSMEGTSRLSIFLKNGTLTVADVIRELDLGPSKFLNELIWREFYYHILARHPRVETEAFQEKYAGIRWGNRERWFEAWKEGRTGYPIVDAAMRELKTTGWMHNRARMIVASFLTKDLLVDWRWGERWFMRELLDGDLAPNNGGWQWAASTGCDAQPYFRIFNPVLQSRRFDPRGEYIRKYVPEFAKLGDREIHEPVRPIVDHAEQKEKALRLYR